MDRSAAESVATSTCTPVIGSLALAVIVAEADASNAQEELEARGIREQALIELVAVATADDDETEAEAAAEQQAREVLYETKRGASEEAKTSAAVTTAGEICWEVSPAVEMIVGGQRPAVRLAGATGENAARVNGVYESTSEVSSGEVTIYRKVGDADAWLEYHAGTGSWQVKRTANKGKDVCHAYCAVPAKCLPEECPVGQWQVERKRYYGIWVPEASIAVSIVSQGELEALKVEAARQVVCTTAVRLAGATGDYDSCVNGVFEPTSEVSSGGIAVYRKVGNADEWLEYDAGEGSWVVKSFTDDGDEWGCASCAVPAKCPPEECPVGEWQVWFDGDYECYDEDACFKEFVPQASVTVSIVSQEELEALRAEAAEAARLCNGTTSVRLAGATEDNAAIVNGVYEPTSQVSSGGITVYRKVGDAGRRLEYHAGTGSWQVKDTADKGKNKGCYASCAVPAKCLPEECPVGQWKVDVESYHDATWVLQASVTVSIVSQGELEAYKAEAARQVVGTTSVRLAGATGDRATYVNGVYEPTSEVSSGKVTVYRKVGDAGRWLEYHADAGRWQVKPTAHKGKDMCWASCAVPANCLPEKCPVGQWQVQDDGSGTFVPQASVTVSVVSQGELEALKASAAAAAEAARQMIGAKFVILTRATGDNAAIVNGVYEPTSEVSSGKVTVYSKVGDAGRWLEYYAGSKQWQVKDTDDKGKNKGRYASCAVPAKCLPEACPVGQWKVCVDGTHVAQASIAVLAASPNFLERLLKGRVRLAGAKDDVLAKCLSKECPVRQWWAQDHYELAPQSIVTVSSITA
jgi:hypothetical protein